MYKFKVGDRVVAKEDWQGAYIEGMEGVVVRMGRTNLGVRFKGFTEGHTLGSTLPDTSGWWVPEKLLLLLDDFEGNA